MSPVKTFAREAPPPTSSPVPVDWRASISAASFGRLVRTQFKYGDIGYYQNEIYLTDPSIFDIFTHEVLFGNPTNALVDVNSIAISESFAQLYFGDSNPVGEVLLTDNSQYRVDLVFRDLPSNSHIKYDALLPYESVINETYIPGESRQLVLVAGLVLLLGQDGSPSARLPLIGIWTATSAITLVTYHYGLTYNFPLVPTILWALSHPLKTVGFFLATLG